MDEAMVKLRQAKAVLLRTGNAAWLERLLVPAPLIESDACPTLSVDMHGRVYFNREYVLERSMGELVAILCHEMEHLRRLHFARAPYGAQSDGGVFQRWNVCADAEINDDLELWFRYSPDITLPAGRITPQGLGLAPGLTAEEYFRQLPAGQTLPDCGTGGSASDGVQRAWELGAPDEEHPGLTEREIREVVKEAASKVPPGRRSAQGAGRESRSELRQFGDVDDARWVQLVVTELRRELRLGTSRYDMMRPNRRLMGVTRAVLPEVVRDRRRALVIVLDVSGSMSESELAIAESIAKQAVNDYRDVWFVACDADVKASVKVTRGADIRQWAIGGGGTNLNPGLVEAVRYQPDVVLLITDGDVGKPYIESNPGTYDLIAVLTKPGRGTAPDWAKRVIRR